MNHSSTNLDMDPNHNKRVQLGTNIGHIKILLPYVYKQRNLVIYYRYFLETPVYYM